VPVETFNYLDSLDQNNPPTSDGLVGGDDHIRGLKATLKSTFPGLVGAATRVIGAAWGFLAGDGSAAAPAFSFSSEPTLGIYRSSAGVMTVKGGTLRTFDEVGEIRMFATPTAPQAGCRATSRRLLVSAPTQTCSRRSARRGAMVTAQAATFSAPGLNDRFPRHRRHMPTRWRSWHLAG
jgi:hypothetical protein